MNFLVEIPARHILSPIALFDVSSFRIDRRVFLTVESKKWEKKTLKSTNTKTCDHRTKAMRPLQRLLRFWYVARSRGGNSSTQGLPVSKPLEIDLFHRRLIAHILLCCHVIFITNLKAVVTTVALRFNGKIQECDCDYWWSDLLDGEITHQLVGVIIRIIGRYNRSRRLRERPGTNGVWNTVNMAVGFIGTVINMLTTRMKLSVAVSTKGFSVGTDDAKLNFTAESHQHAR